MRTRLPVFLALVFAPCAAWPQGNPVGPEFRVNTVTAYDQRDSSVAADSSGNFIVVWSGENISGFRHIFGQRYSSSGAPAGPEFRVNTYTTSGLHSRPSVAVDGLGNFVVVWRSYFFPPQYEVFGQRFASSGAPLGTEFRVNTYTTSYQTNPSVAADGLGNYLVVWQSIVQDGSGYGVFGQRFDSSGVPLGTEFRVNTSTLDSQYTPSIASDASGNFVVTWQSAPDAGIFGQRYSSSGAPLGTEFVVNSPHPGWTFRSPSVDADPSGNFVVVWASGYYPSPGSGGVFGRRFDASGAALGPDFRVNTFTTDNQDDPAVAVDASGNFVVVWASLEQDGSSAGVFGQRYESSGSPLGPEFLVNTYTTGVQDAPKAATDATGRFVVVWDSLDQDGSNWGIFGQRYSMIVPVELMDFGLE